MFGLGRKTSKWRKVTVLDFKTMRPFRTAASAVAGYKELLDAAGYFPDDKFMRSETVRDLRGALKDQAHDLKDQIDAMKSELRDAVEQCALLRDDLDDIEDDQESSAKLQTRLEATQARMSELRTTITRYTLELAAFKADRADFVIAMANHTLGHEPFDPRISRQLHQLN